MLLLLKPSQYRYCTIEDAWGRLIYPSGSQSDDNEKKEEEEEITAPQLPWYDGDIAFLPSDRAFDHNLRD